MSNRPESLQPQLKYQALSDLRNLKRSALYSHFRRKVDDLADETSFPRLSAFLPQNLAPWIVSYLKYAFRCKHPFPSYPATGDRGVYRLQAAGKESVFKVAIAGDWGTGTKEANLVAQGMLALQPDYTIHLGDVYYVGDAAEMEENCLGKTEYGYQGVLWPKGKVGSFALNGNHEMYANGNAYFDLFLPTLGIATSQDGRQLASFFCLENDIWRILALDTGYNSTGKTILGTLINQIPGIGAACKLEDALLQWLRDVVKPKERPRATILLTHHQYFSSFEGDYPRPAQQLMEFFAGQDLLWLWGHEHRWAVYDKYSTGSLSAYGRCVGHGGMPVELAGPKPCSKAPLQYFDGRAYLEDGGTKIGYNGFLNLTIDAGVATLDYRDLNNHSILVETFTAGANGTLAQAFVSVDPEISKGPVAQGFTRARVRRCGHIR